MADDVNITSVNQSIVDYVNAQSQSLEDAVKSIELTLQNAVGQDGLKLSQSSLQDLVAYQNSSFRDRRYGRVNDTFARDVFEQRRQSTINSRPDNSARNRNRQLERDQAEWERDWDDFFRRSNPHRRRGRAFDDLVDSWENEFKRSLFGSINPLKQALTSSITSLASKLGVDKSQVAKEVGSRLGKLAGDAFKSSAIGGRLTREWSGILNGIGGRMGGLFDRFGDRLAAVDMSPEEVVNGNLNRVQQEVNNQQTILNNQEQETVRESPTDEVVNASINDVGERIDDLSEVVREGFNSVLNRPEPSPQDIPNTADPLAGVEEASSGLVGEVTSMTQNTSQVSQALGTVTRGARSTSTALTPLASASTNLADVASSAASSTELLNTGLTAASTGFPWLTAGILGAGLALKGLSLAIGIAKKALSWGFEPIKKAINGIIDIIKSAATRSETRNMKNLQLWKDRVQESISDIHKLAYTVIQDSAKQIMNVWDNILTTVTATQGYSKEGLQDLWSNYADRLTRNGLASVVSSADVMENLESVLKSGLSGSVAEEFAYIATILNKAVPTQDFFQYATTYASLAANAMKNGKSETEAINAANAQLRTFASNLLYASREISGGFSASLINGSSLFEQSAKIALTSRSEDVSQISGVLTSVSAIVGAIAPDLADSIVTAVVDAATGGNASNLTALRSMAGVGASNTAFLKALSEDPKAIFENLFRNLAQLQNMSAENYMEVAEGLSEVFGLSMDAFARVDFAYLADAISAMDVSNKSLNDNLTALASGETTSTASQLRMQKINEYMVEKGLAYVLDNEAARAVQEHMWEEQMMRDLAESTFAIEFAGESAEVVNDIYTGIKRLLGLTSGSLFANTADTLKLTAINLDTQLREMTAVIEAGVVGSGNKTELKNLTTGNKDLGLARSYVDLLTGTDEFKAEYQKLRSYEDQLRYNNQGYLENALDAVYNSIDWSSIGTIGADAMRESIEDELYPSASGGHSFDTSSAAESMLNVGIAAYNAYGEFNELAQEVKKQSEKEAKRYKPSRAYDYKLVSKSSAAPATTAWTARTASTSTEDVPTTESITGWSPVIQGEESTRVLTDAYTKSLKYFSDTATKQQTALDAVAQSITEEGLAHRGYYTQSELLAKVTEQQQAQAETGASAALNFSDWTAEFVKQWNLTASGRNQGRIDSYYRDKTLEDILDAYEISISELERIYNEQETIRANAETRARELHEVQFWEDMQNFATKDFPDYMLDFREYMTNWADYYIRHVAYGNETAGVYVDETGKTIIGDAFTDSKSVGSLMMASEEGQGDAILALAQKLTDNETYRNKTLQELKDPQLQTNAILSKILLVVEAIMQQNNETSIVSVPTSLSSLGLGTTTM